MAKFVHDTYQVSVEVYHDTYRIVDQERYTALILGMVNMDYNWWKYLNTLTLYLIFPLLSFPYECQLL